MHIEINKNDIEKILINTQPFLEKKDLTQITSHIYIKAMRIRYLSKLQIMK